MTDQPRPEIPGPPDFPEIEQQLLGIVLTKGALFEAVSDQVESRHFAEEAYGRIWTVFAAMARDNIPISLATALEPLVEELGWSRTDTTKMLLALTNKAVTVTLHQVTYVASLVRDVWMRREVWQLGHDMLQRTQGGLQNSGAAIIEDAEAKLFAVADADQVQDEHSFTLADAVVAGLDQAAAAAEQYAAGELVGVPTGLTVIDNKLGGWRDTDLIMIGARPGMGKAQPLDAKVLLVNGKFVPMGTIKLGDRLASIDDQSSRVTAIYPQGPKAVYRITFSDGRSAEACAEHLWRVRHRQWPRARTIETAELAELLQNDRNTNRIWIQQVTGDFGDQRGLPIHPWLLGVLLGDGSFRNAGGVSVSSADPEIIARVGALLGDGFRFTQSGKYDYRIVKSVGSGANPLSDIIRSMGLGGLHSHQKFIPAAYLSANRESRLELLRGLMDTDGWAEKYGSVRFVSTSPHLALGVQALVRSLGGLCQIVEKRPHFTHKGIKKAGRLAYQCNIRHEFPAQFFFLDRKAKIARNQHAPRLNVQRVELSRITETQCIRVSHRSHTYVTDHYIVTHNTALALKMARSAAEDFVRRNAEKPKWVLFFSMEMGADQLATRLVAAEAQISFEKIRLGHCDVQDLMKLDEAGKAIRDLPIKIDDTARLSVPAMRTRARRLKRRKGLGLVIVDYLQLVGLSRDEMKDSGGNRVQEISTITRNLKALAKDLQVPVLCLAQLNREVEKREDKRPMLSDLRESGTIEQDADLVAFLYREHYYTASKPPARKDRENELDYSARRVEWQIKCDDLKEVAELIIAKNRHGSAGTLLLKFIAEMMLFPDDTPGGASAKENAERKRQLALDLANKIV